MSKPVILLGNGGHARVLTDILLLEQRVILGYTALHPDKNQYGLPYIGNDEMVTQYSPSTVELVNGLGSTSNTYLRKKLFNSFKKMNYRFTSIIHPETIISPSVHLGEGVQIMAGSVIQPFVKIDDNTIINTSVTVDHDCRISKHCHLAPGTILSGNVKVGDETHIGTGTTIIHNIVIGENVLVGAGSLVIRDLLDNKIYYGSPAKEVIR